MASPGGQGTRIDLNIREIADDGEDFLPTPTSETNLKSQPAVGRANPAKPADTKGA